MYGKAIQELMSTINHSDSLRKLLSQAEDYAEADPEAALNKLRKFWEVVTVELGEEQDKKIRPKNELWKTFNDIKKNTPDRMYYYLEHIHRMGNFGSHWQGGIEPASEDAEYCLWAANEVFEWRYPDTREVSIDQKNDFIKILHDAVPCEFCNQPIGNECLSGKGKSTGTNREHTVRKKAYAKYRRNYQKNYATTLVDCMHQMVADIDLQKAHLITRKEILEWFDERYPAYTETAVSCHAYMMTTNLKTRTHHNLHDDKNYDLFFAEEKKFRLYEPRKDPAPIQSE